MIATLLIILEQATIHMPLIIGAYIAYKQIGGFTKALLERMWSLRHVSNLLKGRLCATVLTGLNHEALDSVNQSLAIELEEMERIPGHPITHSHESRTRKKYGKEAIRIGRLIGERVRTSNKG